MWGCSIIIGVVVVPGATLQTSSCSHSGSDALPLFPESFDGLDEARVLGVLVEKGYSTPDQYPLSLNAVANGCNQKSNRDPIVDFSEAEVRIALQGLRMKGFVGVSVPAGSRVEKWHHNAKETLKLEERDLAVLAELMLRGPQTAGELRGRAKRMRDIPNLEVLDQ